MIKNNQAKISVIIPVYNVEKYLHACLDSLANQTLKDFEAIIVDNNSQDNSPKIIAEYVKKYHNFKTYKKIGGKAGGARNEGLKFATSEYIYFLDSDDTLPPNALETLYNIAQQYNADIVACLENFIDEKGNIVGTEKDTNKQSFLLSVEKDGLLKILIHCGEMARPMTKLFKRAIFADNNLTFPEDVPSEDVAVITTTALFTKIFYQLNEPLYNYRYVPTSLSNSTRDLAPKSLFNNFAILRPKLSNYPFFTYEIKEEWEYRLISMIIGGEGVGNGGLKNISKTRVKEFFNLSKDFYLNLPKCFFKKRNIVFKLKYSLFLFALKHNYYNLHKYTRFLTNIVSTFHKLFFRDKK